MTTEPKDVRGGDEAAEALRVILCDAAVESGVMLSNAGKGRHRMPTADVERIDVLASQLAAAFASEQTPSDPPPVREDPFMYAYECVDDGRWQAYRHQLTRADGSICPGKPLYERPDPLAVSREAVIDLIRDTQVDVVPAQTSVGPGGLVPVITEAAAAVTADAILALTGETSRG